MPLTTARFLLLLGSILYCRLRLTLANVTCVQNPRVPAVTNIGDCHQIEKALPRDGSTSNYFQFPSAFRHRSCLVLVDFELPTDFMSQQRVAYPYERLWPEVANLAATIVRECPVDIRGNWGVASGIMRNTETGTHMYRVSVSGNPKGVRSDGPQPLFNLCPGGRWYNEYKILRTGVVRDPVRATKLASSITIPSYPWLMREALEQEQIPLVFRCSPFRIVSRLTLGLNSGLMQKNAIKQGTGRRKRE
jgi:hypothetical protein